MCGRIVNLFISRTLRLTNVCTLLLNSENIFLNNNHKLAPSTSSFRLEFAQAIRRVIFDPALSHSQLRFKFKHSYVTLMPPNTRRNFIVIFSLSFIGWLETSNSFPPQQSERMRVYVCKYYDISSVGWILNFWNQINKRPKTKCLRSLVLLVLCGSTQERIKSINERQTQSEDKKKRKEKKKTTNMSPINDPATMTTATTTKCRLDSRITSLGMKFNRHTYVWIIV